MYDNLPSISHGKKKNFLNNKFTPFRTATVFSKGRFNKMRKEEDEKQLTEMERIQKENVILAEQVRDLDGQVTCLIKRHQIEMENKNKEIDILQREIEELKQANKNYQNNLRAEVYCRLDERMKEYQKEIEMKDEQIEEDKEKLLKKK
ncbi:MAG: hypothetical protein MJ252_13170, partial [archaeon]|nr:hypothetical protein [archaeon]